MDPRTVQYRCRMADGTGSAGPILTPLFRAWAEPNGLKLVAGTLNLCANRPVAPPAECDRLTPYDSALQFPQRKATPGYDPRLYLIVLQDTQPAWLFRWSDNQHISNFVADTAGCPATHRCEVIAEDHLSELWGLDRGGSVMLRFK